jgi:hypothetical protein
MNFSRRMGLIERPKKGMTETARTMLWNAFHFHYLDLIKSDFGGLPPEMRNFITDLWCFTLKMPAHEAPKCRYDIISQIRPWFMRCEWNEVYDFLEDIVRKGKQSLPNYLELPNGFDETCNNVLEEENTGYRFVNDEITPLTDENLIGEITAAVKKTSTSHNTGANIHLKKALSLLANRKDPDYANCVKEAISAVEAVARDITKNENATLGIALKNIKAHPSLKQAWAHMYGYASDEGGIRHAIKGEEKVGVEEAKYVLACSAAMINYLLALEQ